MTTMGQAAALASAKLFFPNNNRTGSAGRPTRLGWILCPTNPSLPCRRWTAAAAAAVEAPSRSIDMEMEMQRAPVPREQVEVVRSLNGWVAENMLPLLLPVESSWQPHDFLPCSAAAPGASTTEDEALSAFTEGVAKLRAGAAGVPDEVLACLVGNMVTEEALPSYQSMGNRTEGIADDTGDSSLPWAQWMRGWTAEENRHGDLLNRYLYLSGRVDMRQVETTVHHLLRNGMEMLVPKSPYHSVIYGAFQERATFISHVHTAKLAGQHGDQALAKICGVIAADEKRHEAGYTRICAKLFEVDPDGMVRALAYVMRGNAGAAHVGRPRRRRQPLRAVLRRRAARRRLHGEGLRRSGGPLRAQVAGGGARRPVWRGPPRAGVRVRAPAQDPEDGRASPPEGGP